MYFTVTAEGRPLRQRRYYFSEAFCAIANAEYYGVTGDKQRLERARQCYDLYWDLSQGKPDPVGIGPKTVPPAMLPVHAVVQPEPGGALQLSLYPGLGFV